MNWDQSGLSVPARVITDVPDWPEQGPGWVVVAADAHDADCLILGAGAARPSPSPYDLPRLLLVTDDSPAELIDAADGYLFADDPADVSAAIINRLASAERAGFRERRDGPSVMSALSIEAGRIAEALARLAAEALPMGEPAAVDAGLVRRLIRLRRDRDRYFPAEIFADPAWDMLLDLAAARLEGSRVAVSSLCIAAAVPTTTALRWIRSLSEAGIFLREMDESDLRRSWISLSDDAAHGMMAWLRRFAEAFSAR